MATSLFLAKVMGLFLLIVSVILLVNFHKFPKLVKDFAKNSLLIFISGFPALLLGLLIVLNHNIWVNDPRVIITILGWLILVKGVLRLSMPEQLAARVLHMSPKVHFFLLLLVGIVGAYLTLFGFYGPISL
jgi:hypothetical protein